MINRAISLFCIFMCVFTPARAQSTPTDKVDESVVCNEAEKSQDKSIISKTIKSVSKILPKFSVTTPGNKTFGVELLAESGLLAAGKKIGKCKVLNSKLIRENENGPVRGMEIEIQNGEKTFKAYFDSKIETSDMPLHTKSVVVESWFTSSGQPTFVKKTSQYVRMENLENYQGQGIVVDLYVETKEENESGNMKLIKDKTLRCVR